MNILHLGKFYSPVEGGIESICKYVAESMPSFNHEVLCFNIRNKNESDCINGIDVHRAASLGIFKSQPISFSYLGWLKRLIRSHKPDVIHFHYPNPLGGLYLLFCIPRHTKLIIHWHSDIVEQRILHRLVKPIENSLLKRADAVITTSPLYASASNALKRYLNKVSVIPCAIDGDKFRLDDETIIRVNEIKKRYRDKIVFFVGRHVGYKGLSYLLDSIKYISEKCHVIIAGQGPLTSKLKQDFKYANLVWLGKINESELKSYLYAADILAFPSITKNEAFGVVLAEGMFCGTPAVTFNIHGSGVNWVSVGGETGIEVKGFNSEKYGKAIDALLKDDKLRLRLGENARQRVEKMFVMNVVGPQYQNLYNSLF